MLDESMHTFANHGGFNARYYYRESKPNLQSRELLASLVLEVTKSICAVDRNFDHLLRRVEENRAAE
jgi:hypothetical protein